MSRLVRSDLRLRVVKEEDALSAVSDLDSLSRPAPVGAWMEQEATAAPTDGSVGPARGPTRLYRVDDVLLMPRLGVVMSDQGEVYRTASGEALHRWPDMSGWPGVEVTAGGAVFKGKGRGPQIERASVFMPWGGTFNYGHFLIDGLCGLLALEEFGLSREFPPIAGPLKGWQRSAIASAFGARPPPRIQSAPSVRVKELVYTNCMDHFLHAPNGLLGRLAERFRAAQSPAETHGRKVYLSRRGLSMRVMANEAALEEALKHRGFEIIHPERLSFAAQSRLMAETGLLVGATGAGLANALLLPPTAKVVEIQPANFTSQWLRNLSREAGIDWFGYDCPSPAPATDAPWLTRQRRGFRFCYHLNLRDFLGFLDGVA